MRRSKRFAVDPFLSLKVGAGLAAVWLLASLAKPSASAASENSNPLVRRETSSWSLERPIRRRNPYDYRRHTPYGFVNIGGGAFDPSNQPGSGFYGVISSGTEIGSTMDLGLQLSWYHRGSHGERFFASYVDPAGNTVRQEVQTQSVDTDLVPLMGIARVKFPLTPQFQPYVGGGVGYEWLLVEGVDDQGFSFSNDYGGFGAQALMGVTLAASPSTAIYAETVYNFTTVHADFYDPSINATVRESLDFDGVAFHGGLRFRF